MLSLHVYMLPFAEDIAVFTTSPNRKQNRNFVWKIDGETIEVIGNFTYLGVNFTYTLQETWKNSVKMLSDQTHKACNNIYHYFFRFSR